MQVALYKTSLLHNVQQRKVSAPEAMRHTLQTKQPNNQPVSIRPNMPGYEKIHNGSPQRRDT